GVRKIRGTRGAFLIAVRAHRVDVSAVQQRFVCRRVVFLYSLDELVLAHHGSHSLRAPTTPASAKPHTPYGASGAADQMGHRVTQSPARAAGDHPRSTGH